MFLIMTEPYASHDASDIETHTQLMVKTHQHGGCRQTLTAPAVFFSSSELGYRLPLLGPKVHGDLVILFSANSNLRKQ
jgi:hypothetical protein